MRSDDTSGPAATVADLAAALGRIDGSRLDAAGQVALAEARAAAGALAGPLLGAAAPVIDRERYHRLIELAGPDGAHELLDRLCEDLRQVERGLARALAGSGAAEVQAQTHVLIALAGAVGATAVQRLAEALNAAAHRDAAAEIATLGGVALELVAGLSRFVAAEAAAGRGAV